MSTRASLCLCLFTLACITGCGGSADFPDTYPVTGVIKVKGKPIEGAVVTFQLEGGKENAIGTTNSNGEYKLSTFRPSDGAVPGLYRVAVSKPTAAELATDAPPSGQIASGDLPDDYAPPVEAPTGQNAKGKSEIPEKYSNDQLSGLRATVTASNDNHFEFDLE